MKRSDMTVRLLALLLAALLLLPLAACGGDGADDATSAPTDESTGPAPARVDSITVSEIAHYSIVRPDECSDAIKKITAKLNNAMTEKFGDDIHPKTDYFKEGFPAFAIEDCEILIGATNRPESAEFLSALRAKDCGYTIIGKKIVIAGGTDASTERAVNLFISDIVGATLTSEVFMTSAQETVLHSSYDVDELCLGDREIGGFRVVYPAGSKSLSGAAGTLADAVTAASGWVLPIVTDKEPNTDGRPEILIGQTNRAASAPADLAANEAFIGFRGADLLVTGADPTAVLAAVRALIAEFSGQKAEKLVLSADDRRVTFDNGSLTAMSFNVLVSSRSNERDARVLRMVTSYLPDTVGFQEASPEWMTKLKSGLSDTYAWVGEGRDGGSKGEYNPIFYKKNVFTLLDSGTRWLSDTPEVVSKYEQSSLNRIWTYALLERKSDGCRIMVVNTHFDHTDETARDLQAAALVQFLTKCFDRGYPVVLTGDFNTTSDKPCYKTVVASGVVNSFDIREKGTAANTFTNYGASSKIIDFVFVTPAQICVRNYQVCDEKIDGDWPSDHHPVLIEYTVVK